MGKDLGSMVEEINDATSKLSMANKQDDPVCGELLPMAPLLYLTDDAPSSHRLSVCSTATCRNFKR